MKRTTIALGLLVFVLAGCQDMKTKYPTYPAWGWWKQPATTEDQPVSTPTEDELESVESADLPAIELDAPATPAPSAQPRTFSAEELLQLDEHRKSIWQTVQKLRDLGEMSDSERNTLLGLVQANLANWYEPLGTEPPSMDNPNWVPYVVWDFMPDYDFLRARTFWQKVAADRGIDFPILGTRRQLADWVLEFTRSQAAVSSGGSNAANN